MAQDQAKAKVTVITPQVKITHGGKDTTLKGPDAVAALQQLQAYNGIGDLLLKYENKTIKFCCDDTFEELAPLVEEKDVVEPELDCADEAMLLKGAAVDPVVTLAENTKPLVELREPM